MRKVACVLLLCCIAVGCCACSLGDILLFLNIDTVNNIPLAEDVTVEFTDESGRVWLENKHIRSVTLMPSEQENTLSIDLTEEGSQALAKATEANIGKVLEVRVNGEVIVSPVVNEMIEDTAFWLSMGDDYEGCVALFNKLTK